jgi:hypothetical protein
MLKWDLMSLEEIVGLQSEIGMDYSAAAGLL